MIALMNIIPQSYSSTHTHHNIHNLHKHASEHTVLRSLIKLSTHRGTAAALWAGVCWYNVSSQSPPSSGRCGHKLEPQQHTYNREAWWLAARGGSRRSWGAHDWSLPCCQLESLSHLLFSSSSCSREVWQCTLKIIRYRLRSRTLRCFNVLKLICMHDSLSLGAHGCLEWSNLSTAASHTRHMWLLVMQLQTIQCDCNDHLVHVFVRWKPSSFEREGWSCQRPRGRNICATCDLPSSPSSSFTLN